MKEIAAEKLSPARANDLVQVLDLQAQWENMRADGIDSTTKLQSLQKAFESYRSRQAAYAARNPSQPILELSPSRPGRLGAWCRAVRGVFRRADEGSACPTNVLMKVHRLADMIAARLETEPVSRGQSTTNMTSAIQQLDVVIAWCDGIDVGTRIPEVTATI